MSFIHRINNYLLSPCHVLGSFRFSNEQGPCAHRAQGNRQPSTSPTITWNLRFLGGSDTKTGGAGEAEVQDILHRRKGMYIGLEVRQKAPPSRQTAKFNLDEMWLWGVVLSLSHVQLFCDPWTVAHQAPLPLRFPRQEYWSRLPFPSPGDLLDPRIEPTSPALAGGFFF